MIKDLRFQFADFLDQNGCVDTANTYREYASLEKSMTISFCKYLVDQHKDNIDTLTSINTDILENVRAENAKLREALEKIASCKSHHQDDVVSIAKKVLEEAK